MKKLISNWLGEAFEMWGDGCSFLITDDLISFYTFFTVIFAECAYLRASYEAVVAIPFTIILLGYVSNVIVSAVFKSWHEGERKEVYCAIWYVVIFVVLFTIGCFFNVWLSIIMTAIPFIITLIWINVRVFQDTLFCNHHLKIVMVISKLFRNKIFWLFSQIVVLGGPFIAFIVCLAQIPTLAIFWKIVIPIVYAICTPFIAYFEDDTMSNIFELVYDISWSKEQEEREKRIFRDAGID